MTPVPTPFTVYISDHCGCEYRADVSADSSLEATRKAVEFFNNPSWQGPKPEADTVLRIQPAGGKAARMSVREALSKPEA
jgi:hypothetical protein